MKEPKPPELPINAGYHAQEFLDKFHKQDPMKKDNTEIERLAEEYYNSNWADKNENSRKVIKMIFVAAIKSYTAAKDKGVGMKWISVKDSHKPKDDESVLCAANGDGVLLSTCYYSAKRDAYTPYGEAQEDGRVTHWMPLPNRPGDESQSPSDQRGEGSEIDLNNLEKKLNDALGKETAESLTKWLKDQRKGFAINETVILDKGFANESKVLYVGETPNGLISSVCDGGHTWEVMSYRLTKDQPLSDATKDGIDWDAIEKEFKKEFSNYKLFKMDALKIQKDIFSWFRSRHEFQVKHK